MSNIIKRDFQGNLYSFNADRWFNATEAAKRFAKVPNDWIRLPDAERYIEALERRYGKISYVRTSKARLDRGGGTWMHPKLAVRFAQWLELPGTQSYMAALARAIGLNVGKSDFDLARIQRGGRSPGTWRHPVSGRIPCADGRRTGFLRLRGKGGRTVQRTQD